MDDGERSDPQSVVYVIDDDAVREALSGLLRSVGLRVKTFAAAPEFLASKLPDVPSCLVLDVRLPGTAGWISRPSWPRRTSRSRSSSSPATATFR